MTCLLYTSDAADDMQCVDLGGRRIIKKNFFKQKTAYEISECLVGSEMCIRDSFREFLLKLPFFTIDIETEFFADLYLTFHSLSLIHI